MRSPSGLRGALAALAALVVISSCGGSVGTVTIELVAEPGSDLLGRIDRVRLELDNPPTVAEARRNGDGLVLDLEVDSSGALGNLSFEAFDSANALIGVAFSAPVPIASIDGVLTLYVAPPLSVQIAPVGLDPPRLDAGLASLPFGAVVAGGVDPGGQTLSDMLIYNVYDHAFQIGADMPMPMSAQGVTVTPSGFVYLFGGRDSAGELSPRFTVFDTNTAPAGRYLEFDSDPSLARSERAASLGGNRAIVLGDPPVLLSTAIATEVAGPALSGTVTATRIGDIDLAIVVGEGTGSTHAASVRDGTVLAISELPGPPELQRVDHAATAVPGGDVLFVGGSVVGVMQTGALRYRAASSDFVVIDDLLATPRANPAVASTDRYLVVAGGRSDAGDVLDSVEIFDLATLSPVATGTLSSPRVGATAMALGNGQVLILGGRDGSDQPIATLDLFTPDRP